MIAEAPQDRPTTAAAPQFAHESEAGVARLFDRYGVRWLYEPRTFVLRESDGRLLEAFTPDFYLPDVDLYVELTTLRQRLVTAKNRKLRLLRQRYPEIQVKLLYRRDVLSLLQRLRTCCRPDGEAPPVERVLIPAAAIERRVAELGEAITRDYAGDRPVLVGVLRGVVCFMTDLMRRIALPLTIDFLALSSYQAETGPLRLTRELEESIACRRVIVVEDIVDTGMTLHRLLRYLQAQGPRDVRVCALLDRRPRRLIDVPIAYTGFEIGDEFVVGYGLDFEQQYRNLPYIGTLAREATPGRSGGKDSGL